MNSDIIAPTRNDTLSLVRTTFPPHEGIFHLMRRSLRTAAFTALTTAVMLAPTMDAHAATARWSQWFHDDFSRSTPGSNYPAYTGKAGGNSYNNWTSDQVYIMDDSLTVDRTVTL